MNEASPNRSESSPRSILYIDDDPLSRKLIGASLEEEGYSVHLAANGQEGLETFRHVRPGLVLLDLRMPGMGGFEVLERLQELDGEIPILVVSGAGEMEDVIKAMRSGAWNYVVKSLDNLSILIDAVAKAFHDQDIIQEKKHYQSLLEEALAENDYYRNQLETIFNSLPDGLMTVNNRYEIVKFNQTMGQICPLGSQLDHGKSVLELGEKGNEHCLRMLEQSIKEKKQFVNKRVECPHCEGNSRVNLVTTAPLKDQAGKITGATLIIRDITRLEELEEQFHDRRSFKNIVGKSSSMQRLYSLIKQVANVDTTVLITGESGTGKECVMDALHYTGHRSAGPLCKVNCSALSEELLDSELFGHVRGAFTGAHKDKVGRFEAAHGGSIFLDEIGEISHRIQLKLLRVLESKEFERVGSSKTVKVDVRIISATNVDLAQKVKEGSFRQDLYYRLKVMNIHVPPLRERKDDLALLVDHFCRVFSREFDKKILGVTEEVMNIFLRYDWPGNVRELKHAMEHGSLLCPGGTITVDHLPMELMEFEKSGLSSEPRLPSTPRSLTPQHIRQALDEAKGNKAKAAEMLGIHRKTLYRKMHQFDIPLS